MHTNNYNLRWFMDTKSLRSRQVRQAQKLFQYYFRINYCQDKANGAANTLSQYPQQSAKEEITLRAKNVKILYHLQFSLVKVSGFLTSNLSLFYQILKCGTTVLSQLCQFWTSFQDKIPHDSHYTIIGIMRLQLLQLSGNNNKVKMLKLAVSLSEGWKDDKKVLQYLKLSYILEIICFELISCYHNDLLVGYYGNDKTQELITRRFDWSIFYYNMEIYLRECNIYLTSKAICYKPYENF